MTRLSLCMIVRDESATGRWYAAVASQRYLRDHTPMTSSRSSTA